MTLRLAITPGEPAGIGPDLVLALSQQGWPVELVVCANQQLLAQRAQQLGINVTLLPFDAEADAKPQMAGTLTVRDFPLAEPVIPGQLNAANGHYVVDTLTAAGEMV
ncbi:MAG: 4-hydroxythreonine-4-phosphate dehydrogenase PdxA, partial [Alishewanella sp. 34-51-39]